jgi:hypothetical protein
VAGFVTVGKTRNQWRQSALLTIHKEGGAQRAHGFPALHAANIDLTLLGERQMNTNLKAQMMTSAGVPRTSADAASELLQDVFGKDKSPCRLVYGGASLPLGTPVELEVIFEVTG